MNDVIRELDGFYSENIYSGDTDTVYIKKILVSLVEKSFVRTLLGVGEKDSDDAGIFYVWLLAPKKVLPG